MQRKRLSAMVLAIVFLLILTSCSPSAPSLVGRWEITIEDEELGKVDMVYHFKENGEICLEQETGDEIPFSIPFGSFTVEGEILTIYSDGEESFYTFSVTEDTLILAAEGAENLVFQRV